MRSTVTVQALRESERLGERAHVALQVGWLTQLCPESRLEMSTRKLDWLNNGLDGYLRLHKDISRGSFSPTCQGTQTQCDHEGESVSLSVGSDSLQPHGL